MLCLQLPSHSKGTATAPWPVLISQLKVGGWVGLGCHAHERSPISVLTRLYIERLCWCWPSCIICAKIVVGYPQPKPDYRWKGHTVSWIPQSYFSWFSIVLWLTFVKRARCSGNRQCVWHYRRKWRANKVSSFYREEKEWQRKQEERRRRQQVRVL